MRWLVLLSLALIALGILAFYYFGQTLHIHCYRLQGVSVACNTQLYWFDLVAVAEPQFFAPVTRASSEFNCSQRPGESTDSCTSLVVLANEEKEYRLDSRFFNHSSADKTADAINEFIVDDTIFMDAYPTDKITLALVSCIGLPFFLLGALMLWAQLYESGLVFD